MLRFLCRLLMLHDRNLLVNLSMVVRRAVMRSEQHKATTLTPEAGGINARALPIPETTSRYCDALWRGLVPLAETSGLLDCPAFAGRQRCLPDRARPSGLPVVC
jgi:hypothetical protein